MQFSIRPLNPQSDTWLHNLLTENWGSQFMVSRGRFYDASLCPGFVAVHQPSADEKNSTQERVVGVLLYNRHDNECEICLVQTLAENQGIGSSLIEAVKKTAIKEGCNRLWLITTNDNLNAIGFYQRRGFSLAAVHKNALAISRQLKPEIPELGLNNIPLRDEIEFEMYLPTDNMLASEKKPLPDFPLRLARRTIYSSNWVKLHVDRVQLTTGSVIDEFHVVESPRMAVAALVENAQGELLFEQVYRYPTGRLEWEIPAGGIDPEENVLAAAEREVFEKPVTKLRNRHPIYHYYPPTAILQPVSLLYAAPPVLAPAMKIPLKFVRHAG